MEKNTNTSKKKQRPANREEARLLRDDTSENRIGLRKTKKRQTGRKIKLMYSN